MSTNSTPVSTLPQETELSPGSVAATAGRLAASMMDTQSSIACVQIYLRKKSMRGGSAATDGSCSTTDQLAGIAIFPNDSSSLMLARRRQEIPGPLTNGLAATKIARPQPQQTPAGHATAKIHWNTVWSREAVPGLSRQPSSPPQAICHHCHAPSSPNCLRTVTATLRFEHCEPQRAVSIKRDGVIFSGQPRQHWLAAEIAWCAGLWIRIRAASQRKFLETRSVTFTMLLAKRLKD